MFKRSDFQLNRRFAPWQRALLTLLGLSAAYIVFGATLFVIGVGHMNPRLPEYYWHASMMLQVLPLLCSAISWLLFLWSYRKKWLLISLISWCWVAASIPILSQWIQHHV